MARGQSGSPGPLWKQDTVQGMERGSRVWCRLGPDVWQLGALQQAVDNAAECYVLLDPAQPGVPSSVTVTDAANLVPANPPLLDGISDLTQLSYLNEPAILYDLFLRHRQDAIYSLAGPVLIAVNPFKRVPLYSPETANLYKYASDSKQQEALPPHVFLVAGKAYRAMYQNRQSQSMVISGESGAGKTETTKIAMKYLASLAGGTGMEDQILQTNPLLEAFGNAKTLRNNNSSRFGKLINIFFDNSGRICGARIQTYLLEKSRVVHQLPGERSYHIFYQMCRGLSSAERAQLGIPEGERGAAAFAYLAKSGCISIPGTDDARDFQEVKNAMATVGIDANGQAQIWQLLAGILWLGNVEFDAEPDESARVRPDQALNNAAALLQCDPNDLAKVLSSKVINAGGETILTALTMDAALDTRDALAKAIYAALFGHLVSCVNTALAEGKRQSQLSLSILDIYGFECFQENSFEQLCINYANERLQQQFNKHLFQLEQATYQAEGIDWTTVEFEDNQECVDLIEARPPKNVGVLSLLDEQCVFPKATDSTFCAKLRESLSRNRRFSWNTRIPKDEFMIDHYAGRVAYNCLKFLDKNRDSISPDLVGVMLGSQAPLLQLLAGELSRVQERKGAQTVGSRFRDQLRDLLQRLDETELHFVRCIKPNEKQMPAQWDAGLVLHQLRCCGVQEVTRIARAGYPTRYLHSDFAQRYSILIPSLKAGPARGDLQVCQQLLQHFRVGPSMYQIGHTKIFFRAGVLGQLEDMWARVQRSVLLLQSWWRMLGCRRAFLQQRAAATHIQASWRGLAARRAYAELRTCHYAALILQTAWRGFRARRAFMHAVSCAMCIQMAWRRAQVRRRAAGRRQRRAQAMAAHTAEEARFDNIKAHFGLDAGGILVALRSWQHLQQMQAEFGIDLPGIKAVLQAVQIGGVPPATPQRQLSGSPLRQGSLTSQQRLAMANGNLQRGLSNGQDSEPSSPAYSTREANWQANAVAGSPGQQTPGANSTSRPAVLSASAHQQIAMWEEYAGKLEEQLRALVQDNQLLQGALQAVRTSLASGQPASPASTDDRIPASPAAASGASDDYFNFANSTPGDSQGGESRGDAASGREFAVRMKEEFDRKKALFEDDAAFIQEVREGRSQAVGMDPDQELRILKLRFTAFKRDFKARLAGTSSALKQIEKQEKKAEDRARRVTSEVGTPRSVRQSRASRDSDDGWPAAESRAPSETDAGGKKRNIGTKMLSKLTFKQKSPEIRS